MWTHIRNLLGLWVVSCLAATAAQTNYNLALDFSPDVNPGGVWSYGAEPELNGPLYLFGVNGLVFGDGGAPIQYWQLVPGLEPTIYRNATSGTITLSGGLITLPRTMVMLFSGANETTNKFGVARFTANSALGASHELNVEVRPVYDSPIQGDTDFHIVKNGTELFSQFLAGTEGASYSNRLVLLPGDTLDFVVGRGADNSAFASGLKVFVELRIPGANPSPGPPPEQGTFDFDLARDFSPTQNPAGPWSYGAAPELVGPVYLFGVNGLVFGDGGAPIQYWQLVAGLEPTIYRNPSTDNITIGGGIITLPPNMVMLFSGANETTNQFGVARFTSPLPGNRHFTVHTDVSPIYDSPIQGDTDFHVLVNGVELFSQFLAGTQGATFEQVVALGPGDTVDFVVGRGADNSSFASGLKLSANLHHADH